MVLLFSSARRMASFSVSGSVSSRLTPTRASEGSGGTGRGCTVGKSGSGSCWSAGASGVGVSSGSVLTGGADGSCVGAGEGVRRSCVCSGAVVPGVVRGDWRSVPGGAVGSEGRGREPGGTGCCCSVPGGRVASRCAGVCCCCVCVCAVRARNGSPTVLNAFAAAGRCDGCGAAFSLTRVGSAAAGLSFFARAGAAFDFWPPDLPEADAFVVPARAKLAARLKAAREKAILLDAAAKLFRLDIMLSLIYGAESVREETAALWRYVTCLKCRLLKTEIVRQRPARIPFRSSRRESEPTTSRAARWFQKHGFRP